MLRTRSVRALLLVFAVPLAAALLSPAVLAQRLVPAVEVQILDDDETGLFNGTAEFYLAVQTSSLPDDTFVLIPLNVGDFEGSKERFLRLPFAPKADDMIKFQLLEEDKLSEEDVKLISGACRTAGYAIWKGVELYAGIEGQAFSSEDKQEFLSLIDKAAEKSMEGLRYGSFQNYGTAEYIMQKQPPRQPHHANKLTILENRYARAQLRIYFVDEGDKVAKRD